MVIRQNMVWPGWCVLPLLCGFLSLVSYPLEARAEEEEAASSAAQAAAHFDRAVEHFRAADFEAATRAFLMADELAPDSDTLSNALGSAKKSGSHLLVAIVSERAMAMHQTDSGLVRMARAALAKALPHLGRLRLSCRPTPCALFLDDQPVQPGSHLVEPGSHRLRAIISGVEPAAELERDLQVNAGTSYVFTLQPQTENKVDAEKEPPVPADNPSSDEGEAESQPAPASETGFWKTRGDEVVFFSGVSITAGLTGLLVWSGTNTLRARDSLPGEPTADERSSVQAKIRRTDILLGSAIASGALTAAWGIFKTDFRGERVSPEVAILPTGSWYAGVKGVFR